MARRVFFSFHYDRDIWRVNQIRNIGEIVGTSAAGFHDASLWEEAKTKEKAKPGTFQIGISTPTSQVNVGLLNMMAGTNFTMVPYRGGTTQIAGILAGDIPFGMESINVSLPLYRSGKVKILGLVSAQRLSLAPASSPRHPSRARPYPSPSPSPSPALAPFPPSPPAAAPVWRLPERDAPS